MKKTKNQYEKEKARILKSKSSEIEKGNQLFGNWIEYVFNSSEKAESNSLKYQAEQIRVRV